MKELLSFSSECRKKVLHDQCYTGNRPAFSKLSTFVKNTGRGSLVLALETAKTSLRRSVPGHKQIILLVLPDK